MAEEVRLISGAEVVALAPVVHASQKQQWEAYATANQEWILEGLDHRGLPDVDPGLIPKEVYDAKGVHSHKEGQIHFPDIHLPVWQITQAPVNASIVNLDLVTSSSFEHTMVDVIEGREGVLSDISDFSYLTEYSYEVDDGQEAHPQSYILEPVFESFDEGAEVVAFVIAVFPWNNYFRNIFPDTVRGVEVVVDDRCGDTHTFRIDGIDTDYVASGDEHDPKYDRHKYSIEFAEFARFEGSHPTNGSVTYGGADLSGSQTYEEAFGMTYTEKYTDSSKGHCHYVIDVYPSDTLKSSYCTKQPGLYASAVAILFGFILLLILMYDRVVIQRQQKLMAHAARTKAIVSSLFPENVQKRIMDTHESQDRDGQRLSQPRLTSSNEAEVKGAFAFDSKPIADFFPSTTIIFADLTGFTAWSSSREPTQVFSLLETIYSKFDNIARSKRVFKVETVGDCYVAASGLPDPCENHAFVIATFAQTCLSHFHKLVRRMEVVLGPDTAELGLRIGIHSGPVTAGVLRGEKSRFQLFGDTVNTASRIESTGEKNRIHLSAETANLLLAGGTRTMLSQVTLRSEKVTAKGKGEMQTYWLATKGGRIEDTGSIHTRSLNGKEKRYVEWNYMNLRRLLGPLVAIKHADEEHFASDEFWVDPTRAGQTVLDEVQEIIALPAKVSEPPDAVELPLAVDQQLYDFVQCIAGMYRDNPFHNFEHASHVTMSVSKLLSRIVKHETIDYDAMKYEGIESSELHDFTFGITSDPLTQFACAFSGMIHDADHTGVTNATLVEEKDQLAEKYRNQSVAEQNSVDVCWSLLMKATFKDLRKAICKSESEFFRFRQLVVNSVMATDIVDKELGALRKKRWETAFSQEGMVQECSPKRALEDSNRKATIVIEHLIQASDVAHTMQHWHVYLKWNERLFEENYLAYLNGRTAKDPSEGWYQGELGFFDYYIIPLAKKLKECGVFGVASDEYLNYAMNNRSEWSIKGHTIVKGYMDKHRMMEQSFASG
jgi:class 3 adenylate cyclase